MASGVDLKREEAASLSRPTRKYGMLAKGLFLAMDIFYGRKLTLGKMRLLEILARIPYQAWEVRHYHSLNRRFSDPSAVHTADDIIAWSRKAQDNEFWHLQVVDEKMRLDGVQLNWFKDIFAPPIAVFQYNFFCRMLALFNMKAALRLNADFEDHAEHEYMTYVKEHPELDEQPAVSDVVKNYGDFKTWGDVFRRIGLDEREHMNNSLIRCGRESEIVQSIDISEQD